MKKICVELKERSYEIFIGNNILLQENLFDQLICGNEVVVISNEVIGPIYLELILKQLSFCSKLSSFIIPDGEKHKTITTANKIYTHLLEHQYTRQTVLIALGGGVVGDITGYVAATYQRGINFIQLPTTMLALVDSSVGGKTAVNHTLGKNMIGAFHQPIAVISELDFLSTLPEREYLSGLAEVIKYGIIADVEFFKWLQVNVSGIRSRNDDLLEQLILKSCETKAQIVSEDEKEKGIRAILNLGHTFGHAIETLQNYQGLLHGEAVSVGTAMASHLSCALGLISKDDHSQILDLLESFGLPIGLGGSFSIEAFRQAMSLDKKNTNGQLRLVLVNKIGCAQVFVDVDEKLITATLKYFLIDNGVRN